jgi:hypothetical protein
VERGQPLPLKYTGTRGVGYIDVVETLLPYINAINISADFKKMFHTSKY